jgi:solute carrier family 6 amino acid/orphan transporter-like 15/16/17/18/20
LKYLATLLNAVFSGVACFLCFLVGLIFTTGAGEYWLTLFDTYGAMGLSLIALVEIIAIMYVYGHQRFTQDIEDMTGYRPGWYWQITWRFVAPALLFIVLMSSIVFEVQKNPEYTAWIGSEVIFYLRKSPCFRLWLLKSRFV